MVDIREFPFNQQFANSEVFKQLDYDWPVVYLIKWKKYAYVWETYNAYKRTKEHLKNEERNLLDTIFVFSDNEYNKSATLDIESKMIQYAAAEESFVLQNRNEGLRDHEYFDRKKYLAKFEHIRKELQKKGIVNKDLNEIRNSDLFKYSPYKALSEDQYEVVSQIYDDIETWKNGTYIIKWDPWTWKSVVASYLMKYLKSQDKTKNKKICLVVPMTSLRSTFKKVFSKVDWLKSSMVIWPNDVVKDSYDIVIVDEAHRLQQRRAITHYGAYDNINKKLGLPKDTTQLDWILKLSKTQILFYDSNQSIKPADVSAADFAKIKTTNTYELKSQMRVKWWNKYIAFINNIFDWWNADFAQIKNKEYDFKIYDKFDEFRNAILSQDQEHGLSRIVAWYARKWRSQDNSNEYDIEIDGTKMVWNTTNTDWVNSKNAVNEIGCIHTVQWYDLNYVWVILWEELSYNKETWEFVINRSKYYDKKWKMWVTDEYELKRYIINIYKTLLTRGILGTYVYVVDKDLREYLKSKVVLNG